MSSIGEIKKKIVILGDGAVGKTSLIRRFVVDRFDDNYLLTVGFKITAKDLRITLDRKHHYMKLQIWDILGQKGYIELHKSSFPGTAGVIFVADITRKDTLESLDSYWIPNVENLIGEVPYIILANKSDLMTDAELTEEDMKKFAYKYEVPYYFTSAKSGENVEMAFNTIGKKILKLDETRNPKFPEPVTLTYEKNPMVELLDKIIDDFCKEFGRYDDAMPVLRRQFELANFDFNNPTLDDLRNAIDRLANVETGFKDMAVVEANRNKRLKWLKEIEL